MARRLLLVAAALALVVPVYALAQATQLKGTVGPTFTISLTKADGSSVNGIDPGSYAIAVDDRGDIHNFHLFGPGVDMSTSVPAVEMVNWDVTFVNGLYRLQCDAHPTLIRGSFRVGPPPPPPPLRRLTATIGPGAKITLSARRTPRGRYAITVRDRTAKDNFHLTGPGVNRKTGLAFRGQVVWRLTLKKGLYRFRSDANAKLRGTLRVT